MKRMISFLLVMALISASLLALLSWGPAAQAAGSLSPVAQAGTIYYVDIDATTGANDGTSWDDAYTDLQDALALATDGAEIWVASGVYTPTTGTNRNVSFSLQSGVAIYGGFVATETLRSQRDWENNVTTLSGDLNGDDIGFTNNGENSYHVVVAFSGITTSAILDGFTISGGNANGGSPANMGGGMYCNDSSLTLTNVTFINNTAAQADYGGGMWSIWVNTGLTNVTFINNTADYGGGMYNRGSNPTLTGTTFISNTAQDGGGMFNLYSSPVLVNVVFSGNTAQDGGGMYNTRPHNFPISHPTLTDVTFSGNTAQDDGGGMYNEDNSSPSLTNVTFSGNTAQDGGGIFNLDSSPTLTGTTFSGNTAWDDGGGMYSLDSSPTLTGTIFISNTAGDGGGMANLGNSSPSLSATQFISNTAAQGGGMANLGGHPTLVNAIFSGNTAQGGGGMYNSGGHPTLVNATFSGNTASAGGGGIFNFVSGSSTLANSILWGNTAPTGSQIINATILNPISYSLVQGCGGSGVGWDSACGTDGGNNIDANPLFVDAASGDLRLKNLSPAIDAGNNSALPAGLTTDLAGQPRRFDNPFMVDTGSGTAPIVDMGAYENQADCPAGEPIYVDTDAGGSNSGDSWVNALTDLQLGLNLAQSCGLSEIWVAEGTYTPTGGTNRSATFQLQNGVAIYGGFAATETDLSQRDWETNVTILSGDLNGDDSGFTNNNENSYHVVKGDYTDATAILDGFTIRGGNANGGGVDDSGGGMSNNDSSPTLTNLIFDGNSAVWGGGGMSNSGSNLVLTGVTFSGNTAQYGGGMLNGNGSNPVLTDVTFSGNTGSAGGGMHNHLSSPQLTDVIFSDNTATGGGGIFNNDSSPTVINTIFSGNSAADEGGGMLNFSNSSPTLTNVTFSGNSATDGGGMFNTGNSNPIIQNSILWGNTATSGGPQIFNEIIDDSTPTISYSLVQGCGGSGPGWDSSLGTDGGHNLDVDPQFVDAAQHNLRLQATSPAIDAGDNEALSTGLTTDIEGFPRFVDIPGVVDTGNGGAPVVDMGACEAQAGDQNLIYLPLITKNSN